MFKINDDLSIFVTRGDAVVFNLHATTDKGETYIFKPEDVVRIKIMERKGCEDVVFQKVFVVEQETDTVEISLSGEETTIGSVISKPTDYWYEVELNPFTIPQTIIGYDDETGAKIFKLFPEGNSDLKPKDVPVVDRELDLYSDRPIQNQAVAWAVTNAINEMHITTEKAVEDTVTITNNAIAEVNTITEAAVNEFNEIREDTITTVQTSNQETVTAVQTSNQETVTAVQTSNQETLTAVNTSNANTIKEVNDVVADVNTVTENAINEVHTSNENTLAEVNTLVAEVRKELQNVPNAENMANLQRQITENKNSISTNTTNIVNLTTRVENIEGVELTAVNTTYHNSTSGLSATNVQGAIDEVDTKVDKLTDYVYKQHPRTMTVIIDKTDSNPETCITYADDAVGMTPGSDEWDKFFGHYPCLFKNGAEVGKLNPNNFAQFEDGTSADITSGSAGDVMIAFPKLGYKITSNDTTLIVSMTNGSNVEGYCYLAHTRGTTVKDKFYLGAYMGYTLDSKLRSLSGKNPVTSSKISEYRTSAQANGLGYDLNAYYQLVFRQCMYILKYKNLDSQTAVGQGYTSSSNSSIKITGGTNNKGMDYGEDTGTLQMKLFGIEDFWGNCSELIDGIKSDSSRNILIATDEFGESNSYINKGNSGFSSNTDGYMKQVQGNSEMGFITKENGASSSTYFCDNSAIYNSRYGCFGGSLTNGSKSGVFNFRISEMFTVYIGTRLMYL